ncbi:MAG: protein kinase domain-containing protein [Planctomycetota bacterium]
MGRGLLSREQVDSYLEALEEDESLLERLLTDEVIDEQQFGDLQEAYEDYLSRQGEQTITEGTDFEVEATAVRDRSDQAVGTRPDVGDDVTMNDPDITPVTFDAEGVTIDEWDATDGSDAAGGPTTGGDEEDGGVGQLEGQVIGGCKISKKLGQGGMGAVYLADHLGLDKKVAIKVIAGAAATGDAAVQRFVREAKAAAKLAHPNIVGVFNVGRDKGFNFIEMEFIEGKSVRDMIADESLDLEESIRILRESCKGLAHAHQAGLVHRDIKPDNILVSSRGEVKIADFGLARSVEEESMEITRSGQILGTPHFMSPEQCDGAKTDQRTDVYSMGVTMYTMLSGEKPFLGETAMAVLMKHIHEEPPPLREKAPHVPEDLDHIVMRMMAKSLEDRYESCAAVLADLDKWDGGGAIAAPKRRRKKSNKGLLFTMATLAVLAGGGAAAVMMGVVPGVGPGGTNGGNGNGGRPGPVQPVRENPVVIAKRAIDNFDYAKAIGLLDEYLKKKPNDAEAGALLKTARFKDTTKTAREALDAQRYDAAIEAFTAALADAPSQSAKDELQQQIDKAEAARDKALRTEAVQGGLADANREVAAGNFAGALAAVNRVLESDPDNGVASILKGNIEQWAASAAALDNAAASLDRARKLLLEDEDPAGAVGMLSAAQAEMAKATQLDDPKRSLRERHEALTARVTELTRRKDFLNARNTAQEYFDAERWADAVQAFYDAAKDAPDTSTRQQMEAQALQSRHRLADQFLAEAEALLTKDLVDQALIKFRAALGERADPKLATRVKQLTERAATPEGMIYIPAGEYAAGSADSRDKNPEQPPQSLGSYYIAQTEVTNAEYAAFVNDGGYTTEAHWDAEGWKLRERLTDKSGKPGPSSWVDGAPPPGEERHPVSGISWYEASAYAAWAKKRLPTEVEWERAACFDASNNRKLVYPWGGEFDPAAAAIAGRADQTHPVGSHPKDRSPAGLLDVAGNAHEWTSSTTSRAGRTRHVARGGAVGAAEPEVLARLLQRRITPGAAFRQGPLGLRLAADPPRERDGGDDDDDDDDEQGGK